MPERLTEAEVAAIRERWEATERRIVQQEAAAKRAGAMGDQERIRRPEGHEDIPRLLATLEAERARAVAAEAERDRLKEEYEPEEPEPRELTPEEREAQRLMWERHDAEMREKYPTTPLTLDYAYTPADIDKMRRYQRNVIDTRNWVNTVDAIIAAGDALAKAVEDECVYCVEQTLTAWRALTRGEAGTDGE